jgi:hypothetical protein
MLKDACRLTLPPFLIAGSGVGKYEGGFLRRGERKVSGLFGDGLKRNDVAKQLKFSSADVRHALAAQKANLKAIATMQVQVGEL